MNDDLSDFALPAPKGRIEGSPIGWMIAHGIVWALPTGIITFVTGRFATIFRDFNVDLPASAALVMKVATAGPIPWLLVLAALLAADWSLLGSDRATVKPEPGRRPIWAIAMLVVPILLSLAMIGALFLPLMTLMTNLSD